MLNQARLLFRCCFDPGGCFSALTVKAFFFSTNYPSLSLEFGVRKDVNKCMSSCVFNAYLIRPWLLWVFVVLFSFGFLGRPAASAAAGTLPKLPSFNFSATHEFTRIAKKNPFFSMLHNVFLCHTMYLA